MTKITIADLNDEIVELTEENMEGVNGGRSPLVAAFKLGYRIGTFLNEKYGLSDKISDALVSILN